MSYFTGVMRNIGAFIWYQKLHFNGWTQKWSGHTPLSCCFGENHVMKACTIKCFIIMKHTYQLFCSLLKLLYHYFIFLCITTILFSDKPSTSVQTMSFSMPPLWPLTPASWKSSLRFPKVHLCWWYQQLSNWCPGGLWVFWWEIMSLSFRYILQVKIILRQFSFLQHVLYGTNFSWVMSWDIWKAFFI